MEVQTEADLSRADMRRAQILDAAATCFSSQGFHAASMASLAAEAGMSVGQIYRYFENKEAVMDALVERNLAQWSRRIAEVRARSDDLLEEMVDLARYRIEAMGMQAQAALTLEFVAEAARNPRIRTVVRRIDRAMRDHLRASLLRNGVPDDAKLESRIDIISMLIDGWAMRSVKNENLRKEEYLEAIRPLLALLLRCDGKSAAGA